MQRLSLLVVTLMLVAGVPAWAREEARERPPERAAEADSESRRAADGPREGAGRRPRRMHVREIFGDVTDEDIEDILAFAGKHLPRLHEELEHLREEDPKRFRTLCRRLRFEFRQLRDLKERDVKAFRKALEEKHLRADARGLAARFRNSDDPAQKQRLKEKLREILGKVFDAELVKHQAFIRRLQERLKQERKRLNEHADQRADVIKQRLQDLLEGKPEPEPRRKPPGLPRGRPSEAGGPPREPPATPARE